jgi:hypothetical protein
VTSPSRRTAVGVVTVAAVAIAVVYGFTRVGLPRDERERRLDERRIEDLRRVARAIDLHWTRHGSLPAALDALSESTVEDVTFNDPESEEPYEYRVETPSTFELCGSFGTDWLDPSVDLFWSHPMGHHCFDLVVREVKRERDSQADDVARKNEGDAEVSPLELSRPNRTGATAGPPRR